LVAFVSNDHQKVVGFEGLRGRQHMAQQRNTADVVENFGGGRFHASALASSQDNNGERILGHTHI
jgi:hypothetical protein